MIRSLYAKIFIWFWGALLAVVAAVAFFTIASGSQPLGRWWMSLTIDLYACSAMDNYLQGGKPVLERYMRSIDQSWESRRSFSIRMTKTCSVESFPWMC
jgi:hypothetical protein